MPEPIRNNLNFDVIHSLYNTPDNMKAMYPCNAFYEIGFIISGDRKVIMPDHIHYMHPGNVGTTPLNVFLKTLAASDKPYERILLKFTKPMAQQFIDIIGENKFNQLFREYVHDFDPEIGKKIKHLMFEMLRIYNNYDEYSELQLKSYLNVLLTLIIRHRIQPVSSDYIKFTKTNPIIMNVLYYIETNYKSSPSLKDTAAYANVNSEYLSRLFKKIVGSTFSDYQNQIRLRYAHQLLIDTDYSMGMIAELTGFSNANYMSDIFKKEYGLSPSKYRKEYRIGNITTFF